MKEKMKASNSELDGLQKREQAVVFKIAKMCGHAAHVLAHGKAIQYSVLQDGCDVANMYLDLQYPFSGTVICAGLQQYLNEYHITGICSHHDFLSEYAFPAWLKDASLEEAELRLAAMGY